jgi:hypothetical protein
MEGVATKKEGIKIMKKFFKNNSTKLLQKKWRKFMVAAGSAVIACQMAPIITPHAAPKPLAAYIKQYKLCFTLPAITPATHCRFYNRQSKKWLSKSILALSMKKDVQWIIMVPDLVVLLAEQPLADDYDIARLTATYKVAEPYIAKIDGTGYIYPT